MTTSGIEKVSSGPLAVVHTDNKVDADVDQFYSNGLDLEHAFATPGFFRESAYPLWHRLLTYPMPTVALLNGHAFAGGFITAMMHDYRIMNPHVRRTQGKLALPPVSFRVTRIVHVSCDYHHTRLSWSSVQVKFMTQAKHLLTSLSSIFRRVSCA